MPPTAPTPIYNEPYLHRGPPPGTRAVEEVDLESALEALDVDLDDLSMPHASTELARSPRPGSQNPGAARVVTPAASNRAPRPSSSRPIRATTDDGVLIDFEDDDDFNNER